MALRDPVQTRIVIVRRFYVPPGSINGDAVTLRNREAHHAAVVLRLRPGERVIIVDGSRAEHIVELTAVTRREVTGRVVKRRPGSAIPVEIILVQSVAKGAKMDDVIRMGTELGVAAFIPVLTKRTVAEGKGRTERWRRIAVQAAKQSRRTDAPSVADPVPFSDAIERVAGTGLVLILWEGEQMRTIGQALRDAPASARVIVVVGPEGGFDPDEVEGAVARGAQAVSLGPLVLRTETAGAAAVSMVLYELTLRPA